MVRTRLFAALVATLVSTPLAAEPTVIKLASPGPVNSHLHINVFTPWAEAVTADSNGTLEVETHYGGSLGNFGVMYDRVLDNVAEIGFILTAFAGGKFRQQDVASLPFISRNSEEAAYGLWKVYEQGLTTDEFSEVKLLAVWVFPNAALHFNGPLPSLDQMNGKKIIASNAVASQIVEALGASPVTFRPDEAYQALSRKVADGALMPFTGMEVFRIHEVTDHHLDAALGADAAILFMNKEAYAALPEEARAAIDKHSYGALSVLAGEKVDGAWAKGRDLVADSVSTLSAEEEANWREALAPVSKSWAASIDNGQAILEAFTAAVEEYRAEKAASN
jgi:TRAP-type C4-dicarboxylate transport system substrate-binding protein